MFERKETKMSPAIAAKKKMETKKLSSAKKMAKSLNTKNLVDSNEFCNKARGK